MAKGGKKSCPLCGKPVDDAFRPFCSKGCANRDLLSWLGGNYAIAGESASPEDLEDAIIAQERKTYSQ